MIYQIRQSEISDIENLGRVHSQGWQETYPGLLPVDVLAELGSVEARTEKWRNLFASATPLSKYLLVETDTKKIIGFGACGSSHEVGQFASAEIYTLYVLREAQGNGIGKKLLFKMFTHLACKNFETVALKTNANNKNSNSFYQYCGGQAVGQLSREYWSNNVYLWTNLQNYRL